MEIFGESRTMGHLQPLMQAYNAGVCEFEVRRRAPGIILDEGNTMYIYLM